MALAAAFAKTSDAGWVAPGAGGLLVPAVYATIGRERDAADVAADAGSRSKRRRQDDAPERAESDEKTPASTEPAAAAAAASRKRRRDAADAEGAAPDRVDDGATADATPKGSTKRVSLSRRARAALASAPKDTPERLARTVFIGNVPLRTDAKELKQWLLGVVNADKDAASQAKIESIRFRSVPIQAVPIHTSDYRLMRKAAITQGKLDESADSMNAYVVFQSEASASAAGAANGRVFGSHHLRVDWCGKSKDDSKYDHKRSVFLGSLPYDASEEAVREWFAARVTGGHDSIDSVRLIRDRATNKGKGFGYVLFKERTQVAEALGLHGHEFAGRSIRVQRCAVPGAETASGHGGAPSKPTKPMPAHMGRKADAASVPKKPTPTAHAPKLTPAAEALERAKRRAGAASQGSAGASTNTTAPATATGKRSAPLHAAPSRPEPSRPPKAADKPAAAKAAAAPPAKGTPSLPNDAKLQKKRKSSAPAAATA